MARLSLCRLTEAVHALAGSYAERWQLPGLRVGAGLLIAGWLVVGGWQVLGRWWLVVGGLGGAGLR